MKKEMKILDLGCGSNKRAGAFGIDNVDLKVVDLVWDISNFPYPIDSLSVDKIYCSHVIEHFTNDTRNRIMHEIYRILKPGGELEIRVPHAYSICAKMDPTHKSFYIVHTIRYFTENFHYYSGVCNGFNLRKTWINFAFCNHISWFSGKTPVQMSRIQKIFSHLFSHFYNRMFNVSGFLPDLFIKFTPAPFVEILWVLKKIG